MRAAASPSVDYARRWKDHRRACARCELSRPGCAEGREIYAAFREDRAAEAGVDFWPTAQGGSRIGNAFVFGFWFTIGMGVASVVIVIAWLILWTVLIAALFGVQVE